MRSFGIASGVMVTGVMLVGLLGAASAHAASQQAMVEDYVREPLPPGIQVTNGERDGALFADAAGHTLYIWPFKPLRLGETGDRPGKSSCTNTKTTESGGFQEPYPGGLLLPELDRRPTCVDVWPPVLAPADAKPVGRWTIIDRTDGTKQWAYAGRAVYTSALDRRPGDVFGDDRLHKSDAGPHPFFNGAGIASRFPLGPASNVPPSFKVDQVRTGRVLTDASLRSVYTWDNDGTNKSNCRDACLQDWKPVLAPALAQARGEFTIFERAPGLRQWAFKGKPLYTSAEDPEGRGTRFAGIPGWHNVYTQKALPPPKEFQAVESPSGLLLADHRGRTVYLYTCIEDTADNFLCDHPDAPQVYRLAVCGAFDAAKCNQVFPYVPAAKGATSESRLWSVMTIDPATGRRAAEGQKGALAVWAYRDRPVYTHGADEKPGDAYGDGWGMKGGSENGFHAIEMPESPFLTAAK